MDQTPTEKSFNTSQKEFPSANQLDLSGMDQSKMNSINQIETPRSLKLNARVGFNVNSTKGIAFIKLDWTDPFAQRKLNKQIIISCRYSRKENYKFQHVTNIQFEIFSQEINEQHSVILSTKIDLNSIQERQNQYYQDLIDQLYQVETNQKAFIEVKIIILKNNHLINLWQHYKLASQSIEEYNNQIYNEIANGKVLVQPVSQKGNNPKQLFQNQQELRKIAEKLNNEHNKLKEIQSLINQLRNQLEISAKSTPTEIIILKKIQDLKIERQQTQTIISELQLQRENMNQRTEISHPLNQLFLDEEQILQNQEAKKVLNEIKSKMKDELLRIKSAENFIQKQKEDQEIEAKQTQVEQRLQQNQQREEVYKLKIAEIKNRHQIRQETVKHSEQQYQQKREQLLRNQMPLHIRKNKEFREQQTFSRQQNVQTALDEIHQKHPLFSQLNLTEHEMNFKQQLKEKEEELRRKRQQELEKLFIPESIPQVDYQSSKWKNSEDTFVKSKENLEEMKARERDARDARIRFAQGVKQHIIVPIDESVQNQFQLERDKKLNPQQYIKPVIRQIYDEWGQVVIDPENPTPQDMDIYQGYAQAAVQDIDRPGLINLGKQYLKEMHERYPVPQKDHTINVSRLGQSVDQDFQNNITGGAQNNQSMQNLQIDYMDQISQKYQLSQKRNQTQQLQALALDKSLPPIQKNYKILNLAQKTEEQAYKKESLYNVKRKLGKIISSKDAHDREEIDDIYINSIQAQLSILTQNKTSIASSFLESINEQNKVNSSGLN